MDRPAPTTLLHREPTLVARGLSKAFGHVSALVDVSLDAYEGQVLAIVGDNGAGKSTMVKILSGTMVPDSGEVFLGGERVALSSPAASRRAGIATVFQDLALVEPLDVASNLFLGREPTAGPIVRRGRMIREAHERLASLNINVPSVRIAVGLLSGGQRQGVAIARAVLQGGLVVIMDEPTAALGVRETARVEEIISGLRSQGKAIVLVSHDLELVFRLADRIHVQRLGRCAGVVRRDETTRDEVVGLITGTRSLAREAQTWTA